MPQVRLPLPASYRLLLAVDLALVAVALTVAVPGLDAPPAAVRSAAVSVQPDSPTAATLGHPGLTDQRRSALRLAAARDARLWPAVRTHSLPDTVKRHTKKAQRPVHPKHARTPPASVVPAGMRPSAVASVLVGMRQRVNAARAQIPGALDPTITWIVSSDYASWGVTDWYDDTVYLSPDIPISRVADVVKHEYGHVLSVRAYDGDVHRAVLAMNAFFGGAGNGGAERAADCIARLLGADWTNYTACAHAHWRDGARRLLHGQRL